MAKRKTEDVVGFIHNLSPKKAKSFRLQVQCDETTQFKRAICFDVSKHDCLQRKQMSGEPVKLRKVLSQPQPVGSSFAELVLNSSTVVDELDPIKVEFERMVPTVSFTKLDSEFKNGQMVAIRARLDLKHASEKTVFAHSRNCRVLNNGYVYDDAGSFLFSAWDDWIDFLQDELKKGNDYFQFSDLLVREWNGEMSLSTCSDTNASVLDSKQRPNVDLHFDSANENVVVMTVKEFDSVKEILYKFVCSLCDKHVKASKEKLSTCSFCGAIMRSNKLKRRVEIVIKCSDEEDKNHYTVIADEFKPFLDVDPTSFDTDKEELVLQIMSLSNIKLSLNKTTATLSILHIPSVERNKESPADSKKDAVSSDEESITSSQRQDKP